MFCCTETMAATGRLSIGQKQMHGKMQIPMHQVIGPQYGSCGAA